MGNEQSVVFAKSLRKIESLSMTWMQFINLICELNDRCGKFIDPSGRYLLFAIKKGTADTILWKVTVRVCALKINARSAESYRIFTFGQFLNLRKSLHFLLNNTDKDGTFGEVLQNCIIDANNDRDSNTGVCIICMERITDIILPCAHSFCLVCIDQWKEMGKDWCPICRHPLNHDGSDAWVIPNVAETGHLQDYLLSLTESGSTDNWVLS